MHRLGLGVRSALLLVALAVSLLLLPLVLPPLPPPPPCLLFVPVAIMVVLVFLATFVQRQQYSWNSLSIVRINSHFWYVHMNFENLVTSAFFLSIVYLSIHSYWKAKSDGSDRTSVLLRAINRNLMINIQQIEGTFRIQKSTHVMLIVRLRIVWQVETSNKGGGRIGARPRLPEIQPGVMMALPCMAKEMWRRRLRGALQLTGKVRRKKFCYCNHHI